MASNGEGAIKLDVSVCTDYEYIKSVMFDPEMFDRCSDDQTKEVNIEKTACIWLVCSDETGRLGLCALFNGSGATLRIHIHIPKCNRGKKTLEIGKAFLRWVKMKNVSGKCKINTEIPVIYRDVIQFASRLGFKKEGVDRASITKNGNVIDRLYMGIKFKEIV